MPASAACVVLIGLLQYHPPALDTGRRAKAKRGLQPLCARSSSPPLSLALGANLKKSDDDALHGKKGRRPFYRGPLLAEPRGRRPLVMLSPTGRCPLEYI